MDNMRRNNQQVTAYLVQSDSNSEGTWCCKAKKRKMSWKVLFSPLVSRLSKKESERSFLDNGSMLLEDLIGSCDGKSNPIRCYSAAELTRATNNFDHSCIMENVSPYYQMFRGILDNRTIIIKKYITQEYINKDEARSCAIRDIIISMQMSTHKNALKLLGCCLEFSIPALVHENAAKGVLNNHGSLGTNENQSMLPWKTRLHIAKQLANALTYLHTAFPRPIIHRDLRSTCILLDDDYVPKLSNFSLSITIPPKQSHVEDSVKGTYGYADPNFMATGYITAKSDVYSFGVLLLVFLTRRRAACKNQAGKLEPITEDLKLHLSNVRIQIETIVDPKILENIRGDDQAQQQLQDFLELALSCIQTQTEARPDMIDVAKELVRIENSILPC
ncbi:non-functional pseudokinase ZED1-like [Prunus avium]|uniref:Non-functional pseudokinase ZED1-like n=1 Tax=Prunus avium TaxID=42229 RepID=A0A6P5T825_PRUAV|nr:non-functional pseudokinase ZED1-like [Prunus avium]